MTDRSKLLKQAQTEFTNRKRKGLFSPGSELNSELIEEAKRLQEKRRLQDEFLNLDTSTGLRDPSMRLQLSFAENNEGKLNILRKKYDSQLLDDGRIVYRNPDTKNLTTIEDEDFTLSDISEMSGTLPELAFGSTGMIATVAGHPWIGAGMAGGGQLVGNYYRKIIARLLGAKNKLQGKEVAKDLAISFGVGAVAELAGAKLEKGTVHPFSNKINQEVKEGMLEFLKYKGRLTASQATESKVLNFFENLAESSILGKQPFEVFKLKQQNALMKWSDDLIKSLGTRMSPEDFGNFIKIAIEKKENIFRRVSSAFYKKVDDMTKSGKVKTKRLKDEARKLLEDSERPYTQSLKVKTGGRTIDNILVELQDLPGEIYFSRLQDIRSDLSALARESKERIPNRVIGLAKRLSKIADETMEKDHFGLEPDAMKMFRKANKFWKEGKEDFNSKLIKNLIEDNPSQAGKFIFKDKVPENIKLIKKILGKKKFKTAQSSYLEELLKPDKFGVIQGNDVLKRLDNMGVHSLREIFSADHLRSIKNFANIAWKSQKPGSSIGRTVMSLIQGGVVIRLITSGKITADAVGVVVGSAAMSKLFTNKLAIKWLTEGLTTNVNSKRAVILATRLLSIMGKDYLKSNQ